MVRGAKRTAVDFLSHFQWRAEMNYCIVTSPQMIHVEDSSERSYGSVYVSEMCLFFKKLVGVTFFEASL